MSRDYKIQMDNNMFAPIEEEMEFFFSSFFGSSYPSLYRKELCWKPPTDVYETDSYFVVILELAQMNPADVSITYRDGILFIRGMRRSVPPKERRQYHKLEINYGPFERKIAIPDDVDVEALVATYKEGFLEIQLPKLKNNEENVINIKVD